LAFTLLLTIIALYHCQFAPSLMCEIYCQHLTSLKYFFIFIASLMHLLTRAATYDVAGTWLAIEKAASLILTGSNLDKITKINDIF